MLYRNQIERLISILKKKPSKFGTSSLNMSEIRYCLAEKIRLDAVENNVKNYFQEDIDQYNVFVDDYNNRCKNRKYYTSDFTKAKKDVDTREYIIKQDGLARFPERSEKYYESKPLSYSSNSLTRNEMRYCMAEKIRLDVIKAKVNSSSNYEIDKYNKLSNEYNSLCQSRKYYINDHKYVEKQVNARKSIIQQDGINKFWKKKPS